MLLLTQTSIFVLVPVLACLGSAVCSANITSHAQRITEEHMQSCFLHVCALAAGCRLHNVCRRCRISRGALWQGSKISGALTMDAQITEVITPQPFYVITQEEVVQRRRGLTSHADL